MIHRLFLPEQRTTFTLRFALVCTHLTAAAVALAAIGAALLMLAWGIASLRGALA